MKFYENDTFSNAAIHSCCFHIYFAYGHLIIMLFYYLIATTHNLNVLQYQTSTSKYLKFESYIIQGIDVFHLRTFFLPDIGPNK